MATIVSIGSGKGGVGKSILAANLSMLLAKRGKRVVLADLDVGGADAHILFGMLNPPRTLTDFIDRRVERLDEVLQPIWRTLSAIAARDRRYAGYGKSAVCQEKRLIRHFALVQADVIVVDIGAGTSYHALDFSHGRSLCHCGDSRLLRSSISTASSNFGHSPSPLGIPVARCRERSPLRTRFSSIEEVIQAVAETDPNAREVASRTPQGFQPYLIVNRVQASRASTSCT